jgi:DNA-binding NarL/FixJ family response regulator
MRRIGVIAPEPISEHLAQGIHEAGLECAWIGGDAPDERAADVLLVWTPAVGAPAALATHAGPTPIVAVMSQADARGVRKAIEGGADGVVFSEHLADRLAPTVEAVMAAQICIPREARRRLHPPQLTTREKQVLGLVVMGMSNAEIATRLFLSEATVKSHLSNCFRKLGANSRAEASRMITDPAEGLGTGILSIT